MENPPVGTETRLSTTFVMALAAVGSALITVFGSKVDLTWVSIVFALVGLVPWALEAGGVRLRPGVFAAATLVPAAAIVLVDRNPGGLFAVMLTIVWVTVGAPDRRLIVGTVLVGIGLVVGLAVVERTMHETGTVYFLGGLGIALMSGAMLRRQETLLADLREAHALQARHAAATERTRIAREVHDVVAHSLTVTMLHVTGARRVMSADPARAAEALERAEIVGRESLDSIRRVVGLLRDANDDQRGEEPLPVLGDIAGLVDQYRQAGLVVSADVELDGLVADPTTSLTAFRVVQEAMANVLQHSPGAPVDLRVGGNDDRTELRIVVENPTSGEPPRRQRDGLGLLGMAERVRAAGGSVEAGAADGAIWRIEAVLPVRSAPAVTS